jgi:hypothetical protein
MFGCLEWNILPTYQNPKLLLLLVLLRVYSVHFDQELNKGPLEYEGGPLTSWP